MAAWGTLRAAASLRLLRSVLHLRRAAPALGDRLLPMVCAVNHSLLLDVPGGYQKQLELMRRHLLVPGERWGPEGQTELWADSHVTRAFLRKTFLYSRFRGTKRYHEAASALYDSSALPTLHQAKTLFGLSRWAWQGGGKGGRGGGGAAAATATSGGAGDPVKNPFTGRWASPEDRRQLELLATIR